MRILKHIGLADPKGNPRPMLFLAQRVENTAGGLGYSGYLLEAKQLGSQDGRAYVVEGALRHHALAMPGDLEELAEEDQLPLLLGVNPAPQSSGGPVGPAEIEGKESAKDAELLDEAPSAEEVSK